MDRLRHALRYLHNYDHFAAPFDAVDGRCQSRARSLRDFIGEVLQGALANLDPTNLARRFNADTDLAAME
jgi:hypothetical protein